MLLQSVPPDARAVRLEALETELAQREAVLDALKIELLQLQSRYLNEIGALYAQLSELEVAVAEAEIRAGLRLPHIDANIDDEDRFSGHTSSDDDAVIGAGCGNRSGPSDGLKRLFRDVAKTIHPDLALDEPARCRRHSLMAEANRAYADRDEDRLRLIMRAWERSPESVSGDDPDANRLRIDRKLAEINERLVVIDAECAGLRASAIFRLKNKIDEARAQGWDLFSEMVLQVKREIGRTTARLNGLRLNH
jgi:uncharacterized protein YhaN